jgi:hypothetical protein
LTAYIPFDKAFEKTSFHLLSLGVNLLLEPGDLLFFDSRVIPHMLEGTNVYKKSLVLFTHDKMIYKKRKEIK